MAQLAATVRRNGQQHHAAGVKASRKIAGHQTRTGRPTARNTPETAQDAHTYLLLLSVLSALMAAGRRAELVGQTDTENTPMAG